jgi:hypothetical protein
VQPVEDAVAFVDQVIAAFGQQPQNARLILSRDLTKTVVA